MKLRPTQPLPAADRAAELVERSLGEPVHVDIIVPRTTVAGKMRLVSRAQRFTVVAETRQALVDAGFPVDATAITALGALEEYNREFGARMLAIAVRDPQNTDRALSSIEEWRDCDDDQLGTLWVRYQDLQAELDPMGEGDGLSKEDAAAMLDAAKKKDVGLLMSYGSLKLALFATTSAAPPAISATPTS